MIYIRMMTMVDDEDGGAGDDGSDQAVRAAIEKMAEEGEVYTGVFTQVAFIIIVLVGRIIVGRMIIIILVETIIIIVLVGRMIRERMMLGLVVVLMTIE